MDLTKQYDFSLLANECERWVIDTLGQLLEEDRYSKVCRCQDCVLDMVALALNRLKPVYRVSLLGALYAKSPAEEGFMHELEATVRESIEKISSNPSHD